MRELAQLRGLLVSAIERARGERQRDGTDVSTGRYEGLCLALAILDAELQKARRAAPQLPGQT